MEERIWERDELRDNSQWRRRRPTIGCVYWVMSACEAGSYTIAPSDSFISVRCRNVLVYLLRAVDWSANLAITGLDDRFVAELAERHWNADDDAAQQQIEDTGHVGQLERTGRFLLISTPRQTDRQTDHCTLPPWLAVTRQGHNRDGQEAVRHRVGLRLRGLRPFQQ